MKTGHKNLRIGVDVGGTNTDAVLMCGSAIIASTKSPTTRSVREGIVKAISAIIASGGAAASDVSFVSIGTTHFTNAFVQRRSLDSVGVIRIALPAAQALPPMTDWPADISSVLGGHTITVRGGYQYDGRVNSDLDELAVADAARQFKSRNLNSIALSALFAPVNDAMELRAAEIISHEHPDCAITLSSRIGRIGLLERENAGIMNASLVTLARDTVTGFKSALEELGIAAPFYVSQNDGTLMSADFVEQYPVLTFASGPTNSMRGAAYLSGLKDALVADIGGTTTDIGVLSNGFPRESSVMVDIGGVRTNFRMPDIIALGLGGGSIVTLLKGGGVQIGPQSVGYNITTQAVVFGGETLTATDLAVAAGYADIGDRSRVARLDKRVIEDGVTEMHRLVEAGLDRMKTSGDAAPLVLVGGGSVLINRELKGISEVRTHSDAGVANAIGASIAKIGGETDKVYSYDVEGREAAMEDAIASAKARAVAAGAGADSLEIMDIEELPLAYVPGGAVRLRVKVAGDLAAAGVNQR
ncbi:hydantoinase/oxoprolinase N-terminal domain-containing protein [Hyphomonas oceanitis]|uniref:hydantoinase/oxoprolinase N-terminal domain-containing protein n=1 Tax=Hyphomonas oceanitis TaxID=81033 RepID=UPI003AB93A3F